MRALLFSLTIACLGCDSLADSPRSPETRAPGLDCGSCYVVNAALATLGESVFVGGYVGDTNRGVLRRFSSGKWTSVELGSPLSAIQQLSAADDALYLSADQRVFRLGLASGGLEALDAQGKLVWAGADAALVVFDEGVARRANADTWSELPTELGDPAAVSGKDQDHLYLLDTSGEIAQASETGFSRLSEQPPMHVKNIAVAGESLLAVSGEDHGESTGPGAIMRFADGHWTTLAEAPNDALLGIASHDDVIYAVGATRRGGAAIPVAWHFDGARWRRHELRGNDAFLWAAQCTGGGVCYASGTDNLFLDLGLFD